MRARHLVSTYSYFSLISFLLSIICYLLLLPCPGASLFRPIPSHHFSHLHITDRCCDRPSYPLLCRDINHRRRCFSVPRSYCREVRLAGWRGSSVSRLLPPAAEPVVPGELHSRASASELGGNARHPLLRGRCICRYFYLYFSKAL
jgi:hypothetical protein